MCFICVGAVEVCCIAVLVSWIGIGNGISAGLKVLPVVEWCTALEWWIAVLFLVPYIL